MASIFLILVLFEMDSKWFEPFVSCFFNEWEELWNLSEEMSTLADELS